MGKKEYVNELASQLKRPLMGYMFSLRLPKDIDFAEEASSLAISVEWPGLSINTEQELPWLSNFSVTMASGWAGGEQILITFIESATNRVVTKMLESWFDRMFYEDSTLKAPINYWREIELTLEDMDSTPVIKLVATHAYPGIIYKASLSYENNDVMKVEVPFFYSNVYRRRARK